MRFEYSLTLVACVLVSLHYVEALAQGSPQVTAVRERCVAETKARTAAMVAKDWPQLEQIAERYISICGTVFGARDLSTAYEAKATALIRLQRLPEALQTLASCIETYYPNSGCHSKRVMALIDLNRRDEARSALAIAEQVARHNLVTSHVESRTLSHSSEAELLRAQREEFQSHIELLEVLKRQLEQR